MIAPDRPQRPAALAPHAVAAPSGIAAAARVTVDLARERAERRRRASGAHQPLRVQWPPWRCRWGWHRWAYREPGGLRTADPPGRGRRVCTLVSRCARCDIVRHEQNVAVPRRPRSRP